MASKKDKEFSRKEDDPHSRRRRQYAFDDVAALNKGVTPAMATKDDFVLAYKTSSNKVQYICDNKDLLLPWAQILTARLKTAGKLGSILESETVPKVENTVLPASTSDLTNLTEGSAVGEFGLDISDTGHHIPLTDDDINILEGQKHTPPEETASNVVKYEIDIENEGYTYEPIPDENMSEIHETLFQSELVNEAATSTDTIYEGDIDHSSIERNDDAHMLEPDLSIIKPQHNKAETDSFTPVYAAEDRIRKRSREVVDQTKTKGMITDTITIKWGKSDLVDYRDVNHTGYFRDQRRRIDMIIVIDDTAHREIELIKDAFFTNCINAGLELELEMGVQPKNSGLVFIKLHAPDAIIRQLGNHYSYKKYFKNNHLEFCNDAVTDEKDIIKSVRRNYPGPDDYSTFDRIFIVYRFLRFMPFGDEENYRGIERLMERGIFRDVYPLHDGPYYVVDQTYTSINGRQNALYHMTQGLCKNPRSMDFLNPILHRFNVIRNMGLHLRDPRDLRDGKKCSI